MEVSGRGGINRIKNSQSKELEENISEDRLVKMDASGEGNVNDEVGDPLLKVSIEGIDDETGNVDLPEKNEAGIDNAFIAQVPSHIMEHEHDVERVTKLVMDSCDGPGSSIAHNHLMNIYYG